MTSNPHIDRALTFTPIMHKAIREGRKDVTRRLANIAHVEHSIDRVELAYDPHNPGAVTWRAVQDDGEDGYQETFLKCSYKPGQVVACVTHWRTSQLLDKLRPVELAEMPDRLIRICWEGSGGADSRRGKLRQARFFPRSLYHVAPLRRIVDVRLERLGEITEGDALREGIYERRIVVDTNCNGGVHSEEHADRYFHDGDSCPDEGFECAVDAYFNLLDAIHGDGASAENPLVWRIELGATTEESSVDGGVA